LNALSAAVALAESCDVSIATRAASIR